MSHKGVHSSFSNASPHSVVFLPLSVVQAAAVAHSTDIHTHARHRRHMHIQPPLTSPPRPFVSQSSPFSRSLGAGGVWHDAHKYHRPAIIGTYACTGGGFACASIPTWIRGKPRIGGHQQQHPRPQSKMFVVHIFLFYSLGQVFASSGSRDPNNDPLRHCVLLAGTNRRVRTTRWFHPSLFSLEHAIPLIFVIILQSPIPKHTPPLHNALCLTSTQLHPSTHSFHSLPRSTLTTTTTNSYSKRARGPSASCSTAQSPSGRPSKVRRSASSVPTRADTNGRTSSRTPNCKARIHFHPSVWFRWALAHQ